MHARDPARCLSSNGRTMHQEAARKAKEEEAARKAKEEEERKRREAVSNS